MAVIAMDEEDVVDPLVTREEVGTSVIFDSEEDIKEITQYISGSKWSVTYFNQVLGVNSEPMLPDIEAPASNQSYYKISDLVIYTDTNIEMSNVKDITGSGTINAGFIPRYGDVFVANIAGGRIGMFSIQEVTRKTYNLHDIYDITFKLHVMVDSEPELYNNVLYKTVKNYVYDKDFILDYNAPILVESDYKKKISLKQVPKEIVSYYIDNFFDEESNTFILPTDVSIYMDQYLLDFIFKIISTDDDFRMVKATRYQLESIDDVNRTIFDVLISKNVKIIKRLNKELKFYLIPPVSARPQVSLLYYSNISYIIRDTEFKLAKFNIIENEDYEDRDIEIFEEPLGNTELKYVFTDAFYNKDFDNMGYFEKLVYSYLEDIVVDEILLYKAIDNYETYCTRDQYYLLPILVLIVRSASQHIYKEM